MPAACGISQTVEAATACPSRARSPGFYDVPGRVSPAPTESQPPRSPAERPWPQLKPRSGCQTNIKARQACRQGCRPGISQMRTRSSRPESANMDNATDKPDGTATITEQSTSVLDGGVCCVMSFGQDNSMSGIPAPPCFPESCGQSRGTSLESEMRGQQLGGPVSCGICPGWRPAKRSGSTWPVRRFRGGRW